MTTDILPGILARAITDSLKQAAAEAPDFASEARNLAVLARHCEYMLQEARAVEAEVKELVNEGVEAGVLRRRCESGLQTISEATEATDQVLQLVGRAAPVQTSDLVATRATETVDNVRQELVRIRAVFLGYMEVLNRPLSAIDWEALEKESRADREAGAYIRYETTADIMRDFGDVGRSRGTA